MSIEVKSNLPVPDNDNASVRLFFVKDSELSLTWHICDAALGGVIHGVKYFMALHGSWIKPAVQYDTVLQVKLASGANAQFCGRCLDEYQLAEATIRERRLLKFK